MKDFFIRPFEEKDREAANALGTPVVDWWHNQASGSSLHLVAQSLETGELVAHLQARDRSVPKPSRRPGQCHSMLSTAPAHRRKGIGTDLYDRLEEFARHRNSSLLYAGYSDIPNAPAASFLERRGFKFLERFLPSTLDLLAFDSSSHRAALDRMADQSITLSTYAELGDTPENRLRLYELEQAARAVQPFRAVEDYIPTFYTHWEEEFVRRDPAEIFIALDQSTGQYAGVVTALEWNFTGVHPHRQGRGIATALKVHALDQAKTKGIARIETENHEDNVAMLAINRKLGFIPGVPEVVCIKKLVPD